MKKYKLNIPDMIKRQDAHKADYLKAFSGVTENFVKENDIPKEWLELTEDKPVSADEWLDNFDFNNWGDSIGGSLLEGFREGEENDRKRTQGLIDACLAYVTNNPDSDKKIRLALVNMELQ